MPDEAVEQVFADEEKWVGVDTGARVCATHPFEPVFAIYGRPSIIGKSRLFSGSDSKIVPVVDSKVLARGRQAVAADLDLERLKLGDRQLKAEMSHGSHFSLLIQINTDASSYLQ